MKPVPLILLLALAACGRPAAGQAGDAPENRAATAAPAFDRSVDDAADREVGRLVILCDPVRFRLSFRHRADAASLDGSYPRRIVIDPETLVQYFPNRAGENQFRSDLVRYETCGPLVIRLQGDFVNGNIQGEMGAVPPFVAVTVWSHNRTFFPVDRAGPRRVAECDSTNRRWDDCPANYAVRIDMAYDRPTDRMLTREWVRSGGLMDRSAPMVESERQSSAQAYLEHWSPPPDGTP